MTWNIPILIGLLLIVILYFIFFFKYREPKGNIAYPTLFLFGVSLLYLTIGSPLLAISYLSFSFHMIQMSILFFIVPPLLLLSIPPYLYKQLLNISFFNKIRPLFISPHLSLYLFATLFLIYHIPMILTAISEQPAIQKSYLTFLFLLSVRMLWPIASPNPTDRLTAYKRKRYTLISGFIITPACLLFIVSGLFSGMNNPFLSEMTTHLCLPASMQSIELLPKPFNTKYDQMMSGLFMMGVHKLGLSVTSKLSAPK